MACHSSRTERRETSALKQKRVFDRNLSSGHMVNWAGRLYQRALNARLSAIGASAGQVTVFLALAEHGVLSQRGLVERAAADQSTMAMTLARMERDGLVLRTRDPKDARSRLYSLTPAGQAILDRLYDALEIGDAEALVDFTAEEKAQLIGFLRRIIAQLTQKPGA
jgi:DNA-binding MarR family transcriptional regulator